MAMDPEKSIFDDDSEFNQIWWRCYRYSVGCVGQVSSAFDEYFSRKPKLKINEIFHVNGGTDIHVMYVVCNVDHMLNL